MLGFSELWLPALIVLAIVIFGRKAFLKAYRDWRGVKQDMKTIDNEFKQSKEIVMEAK